MEAKKVGGRGDETAASDRCWDRKLIRGELRSCEGVSDFD
jgi:hypothetical protein